MPDTYCPLPFIHQLVNTNGTVRPCCMARIDDKGELGEWNKLDYKEGIVTTKHLQTRSLMKQGKWPKCCTICKDQESQGVQSFRQTSLEQFGHIDRHKLNVQYLDIKFTNTCNLACRMCKPSDSSQLEELYTHQKIENSAKMY